MCFNQGVPVKITMDQTRHRSVETLITTYQSSAEEQLAAASDAIQWGGRYEDMIAPTPGAGAAPAAAPAIAAVQAHVEGFEWPDLDIPMVAASSTPAIPALNDMVAMETRLHEDSSPRADELAHAHTARLRELHSLTILTMAGQHRGSALGIAHQAGWRPTQEPSAIRRCI